MEPKPEPPMRVRPTVVAADGADDGEHLAGEIDEPSTGPSSADEVESMGGGYRWSPHRFLTDSGASPADSARVHLARCGAVRRSPGWTLPIATLGDRREPFRRSPSPRRSQRRSSPRRRGRSDAATAAGAQAEPAGRLYRRRRALGRASSSVRSLCETALIVGGRIPIEEARDAVTAVCEGARVGPADARGKCHAAAVALDGRLDADELA